MGCGYDYDYLIPRGSLSYFLNELCQLWPHWLGERAGGVLFGEREVPPERHLATEAGAVLYRDAAMRERFHREGGFVEFDGASPLNIWILGWDEHWLHVDFVIDGLPPSPFLARIFDYIAHSIVRSRREHLEQEDTAQINHYLTLMNPEWVGRNWSVLLQLEPELAAALALCDGFSSSPVSVDWAYTLPTRLLQLQRAAQEEQAAEGSVRVLARFVARTVVRLVGQWHRIHFSTAENRGYTMPPGELRIEHGSCQIGAGGRAMQWSPAERPTFFKK